jgi:hypothetical protein
MMDNAQEFKRKWNLEDNKGIKHKTSNIPSTSKDLLASVAKDIGIVVEDGNPILDKMVELDSSRMADNIAECKQVSCSCKVLVPEIGTQDTGTKMNKPFVSPKNSGQNGNSDNQVDSQEMGWSTVGPKKKNRKRK